MVWTSLDPYALVIALCTALAVLKALRGARRTAPGATDVLAWLLLWIPFDLRWWNELYAGPGGQYGYEVWAVYVTGVALLGWGLCRRSPTLGIRVPRTRDVLVSLGALLTLAALLSRFWGGCLDQYRSFAHYLRKSGLCGGDPTTHPLTSRVSRPRF